ncbi:MAG: hypothetical protein IKL52_04160 [Candidatus Gastranaerophilales bacterium]|nr:hypothetical protein [Candidatus Gastranaerophilales bacterium]
MTPVSSTPSTPSISTTTSAPAVSMPSPSIFSSAETAGSIASSGSTFCVNA